MRDGLYQVTHRGICAAFVVRHGKVTECAPILRKRIEYWKIKARWIGPDPRDPTENSVGNSVG